MNISDAKDGDEIEVGGICNYYGGLLIMRSKGRFYWAIEDYSNTEFEEIPKSLFNELFKYNDFKRRAKNDIHSG